MAPGVLLAAPASGAIESDGVALYWTDALGVRHSLMGGGGSTLAASYNLGGAAADQTFTLKDTKGGAFIVDGTDAGFTGTYAMQVKGTGSGLVNFPRVGGLSAVSSISVAAALGAAWNAVNFPASTLTLTGGPASATAVAQVHVGAAVINGAGNTVTDAYNVLFDAAPAGTATITRGWSLGAAGAVQFGAGLVLGASLSPPTESDLVVENGATVVSQANTGRLGYRTSTQQFFVSANGGGYVPLLMGPAAGGFTQGSVPFGSATGTLIQNNPNFFWDNTNFRLGIGVTSPTATLQIVQPIVNAAVPSAFVLTGGAHTAITSANEDIGANFNFSATKQWATGSIATQREVLFQAPTYSFVGTSTITTAATVAISGAPIAGANATLTNPLAFWVQGGSSQFIGTQSVVSATGAKWNALSVGTSTLTLTGATTPVTALSLVTLAAPSVSAASAITIATAATLTIAGPPAGVGAGPATLTNPLALLVASGNSQFSNNVGINTTIGAVTSLEVVTGVSTSTAGNSTFPGTIKITNNGIDTTNAVGGLEWQYDVGGSGFKIGVVSGTSSLAVFKRDFSTAWTQMFGFKSNGNAGIPVGANFYKKFRVDTSPPASPTITAAAIDSVGWNGIDFLGTLTLGGAAGDVTTLNAVYIEAPTINASSAVVIADFFTCRIGTASFGGAGPASAARNWSLGVDGNTKFGGGLTIHSTDVNVAGPYIILATDYYLQVRRTATSAISLNLPSIAIVGNGFVIQAKDSGYNAAVNPITWVRNGADTIENVAGNYPQNVTGSLIKFTSNATTNNWELS
jgi:hypothetical protein